MSEIIKKYNELNWKSLIRENLGDSGNLKEAEETFKQIKYIFDSIIDSLKLVENIPSYNQAISRSFNDFLQFCETQILANYTDVNQRPQKIQQIQSQMQNIVNSLSPIFSYIKFIKTEDKDEKIKEANNIISEFKNKSKELEKSIKDAEGIIENVKKTAQQEEIKKFGRFFEKISEKNQKNAKNNFRYMIASVLITLFLAFIFIGNITFPEYKGIGNLLKSLLIEQSLLLKVVVVSAGGFLISHFSRNYSAEQNLHYQNLQRQNALDSHEQILKSIQGTQSENELETQNILLTKMANAIFEQQETGYLNGSGNHINPTTQVLEVSKTLSGNK